MHLFEVPGPEESATCGVKELARKNTPLPLTQFFARHSSAAMLAYVEEAYDRSPQRGNLQVLNHLEMKDQITSLSGKTDDVAKAYDELNAEYEVLAAKCNLPLDRSVWKMFNQWSHPEVVINLVTGKTHSTAGNSFRNRPTECVTSCSWPWIAAGRVAKAALEPADLPSSERVTPCERCKEKLPEWAKLEAIH